MVSVNKLLKNISSVYEISLSIGQSLDVKENCEAFIRILNYQKKLAFSSVWIKDETGGYELAAGLPAFRISEKKISGKHLISRTLETESFFSKTYENSDFDELNQENDINEGTYGIFKLGEIGFLKIYDLKRKERFEPKEVVQLLSVFKVLAISIQGCLAHKQLALETSAKIAAQESLLESNRRLEDLFQNMNDALLIVNPDGQLKSVNVAARRLFGISDQDPTSFYLHDFIYNKDKEQIKGYFEKLKKEGQYIGYIGRVKSLNGEVKWVQVNSNTIYENGKLVGYRDLVRDISGEKKAEAIILKNQRQLQQLIDGALDAIISINSKGEVIGWNPQSEYLFEFLKREVLGKRIADLIFPTTAKKAMDQGLDKFFETYPFFKFNTRLELLAVKKSGRRFPVEASVNPVGEGDAAIYNCFIRDLTQKKKAEQELLEAQGLIVKSEEKYRGVLENMELGLLEMDEEQNILKAYEKFCDMVGYSEDELIGQSAKNLLLHESFYESNEIQKENRAKGESDVYELMLVHKSGRNIWTLVSGTPIFDSDGKYIGSMGIYFDLTERKKLEEDLSNAKQEAELGRLAEQQFLANMSHEIRTPMNAVIGMTNLLYKTNPTVEQKEFLDVLRFSADSLMGLIDNILDISKIEAGKLELENTKINLQKLIKNLHLTFQYKVKDRPISVVLDFDSAIENYVIGDPTRLNQILFNLMGNSSKFTERGTIGLRVDLEKEEKGVSWILFSVYDTGVGIKKEELEYIFDSFKQADIQTTRKYGGTGLGLAIVRQLVELQKGKIKVESDFGRGAMFKVLLPMKNTGEKIPEQETQITEQYPEAPEKLKGLSFLVAEDNKMNQKFITKVLELWNCNFELAASGIEAVEMSQNQRFDIILMDIHMPGMDGVEASEKIRGNTKNPNFKTPIIALTAAALTQEKNRALDAGMNNFLTKPFSPGMLKGQIFECLKLPSGLNTENDKPESDDCELSANGNSKNSIIDLTYLKEFCGGDEHFIKEMLETYLKEIPLALNVLNEALSNSHNEKVYEVVHRMKPNFGMLGMKTQEQDAGEIEKLIKEENLPVDELKGKVQNLSASVRRSFCEVESLVEQF